MDLLLIAESIQHQLLPTHIDLLAVAEFFRSFSPGRVRMLIPGGNVREMASEIAETHGIDVIGIEHDQLGLPHPGLVSDAIKKITKQYSPDVICLSHTMRACQIAASVAHYTGGACISAVEKIREEQGRLTFRRSLFNGKLLIEIIPQTTPTVLTVLSGAFRFQKKTGAVNKGSVTFVDLPVSSDKFIPLELLASEDKDNAVEEADTIVSAGRGIGKSDNMALIRELSEILKNSAVAGSRTVCDLGWLPYSRQIGETGKQVAPQLYLACGISGARQHTVGIQQARTVIAINTDPHAVIFSVADFGIVEDLTTFIPLLVGKYRQQTEG